MSRAGQITQPALDISGSGTLLKTGSGILVFGGGGNVHWNLGSGALIDVEGGTLVGGSFVEDFWTNNLASLHIAAGAISKGRRQISRWMPSLARAPSQAVIISPAILRPPLV